MTNNEILLLKELKKYKKAHEKACERLEQMDQLLAELDPENSLGEKGIKREKWKEITLKND